MKIAICIPTLNESKTIRNTTSLVDQGLQKYQEDECIIVNCDNNSDDETKELFLSTRTNSQKISISTSDREIGKGYNLVNFWRYMVENGVDCGATIDADIQTLDSTWPQKLIDPILIRKIDYVTPLYERSRFEGSTTNHFAYPYLYAFSRCIIRQPIGGEFGFSNRLADYWLSQKKIDTDYKYGIDIFMTMHAVGGGFNNAETFLGKKIHNPSFPKILPMFKQVYLSGVSIFDNYTCNVRLNDKDNHLVKKCCISESKIFSHKDDALILAMAQREQIMKKISSYRSILPKTILESILGNNPLNANSWTDILSEFLSKSLSNHENSSYYASLIAPLFILRTTGFWLETENTLSSDIERKLFQQAILLRKKMVNKLKAN